MKELQLLKATTPISASVEDAAATQVHYTIITIDFVSLNHDSIVFVLQYPFPRIVRVPRQ